MGVARAGDKAQLTGHWNYNASQSDDADQKVHEAQVNNEPGANDGHRRRGRSDGRNQLSGRGRMAEAMDPSIGGMGGRGGMGAWADGRHGSRHRQGTRGPEVTSEEWDRLAANPKYLQIDQRSDQIVVSNDSDQGQTFYPDGKKHDDKDVDGKKITTKANWEGDAFVAETKLSHSQKSRETYRLSNDGKQLYVTTRFEDFLAQRAGHHPARVMTHGKTPAR